tara:strand:- start:35218 stop:36360 length:1143 start_codon:yes stop_codon:yes gene_type:complete
MHIAFLTPEYPHSKTSDSAGIGTSIKNLAIELVKNKHTVTIFVYSEDANEVFEEQGITIHKIAYKKYKILSWYLYRKLIQNYINNIIQANQIDLIEVPDWTGITAFMKFKCKLLIRLHGTDAYFCQLEGRKQKLKNHFFEKIGLKSADNITSVSEFTAIKTKELFGIKKKIKIIHNGVDIHSFSTSNVKVTANSILYFGSIIRKKGVLELAEIFNEVIKKNSNAQLTLLGKDVVDVFSNTPTIQCFMDALTDEAKKNTKHISHVPYEEVQAYIAKASVIVLPSFAEAFPMTWLEAMAMGKALVTSNIGWATELMIDGETGFIENPKKHQLYADKISILLENKELNTSFGKNAKQHIASRFSQAIIAKENIEYFKSIIQNK